MTGLAAYAVHEAEMELARATAVHALTQTGATHDEAVAAVRQHILADGPRHGLPFAVTVDQLTWSVQQIGSTFASIGRAMAHAFNNAAPRLHQLQDIFTEDDVHAWVKRNPEWPFCCPECTAIIPICSNPGPRTKLRCNDCRVQWRPGVRLRRRDAIRTPRGTVFIDECTGLPRTRPWVGGRR